MQLDVKPEVIYQTQHTQHTSLVSSCLPSRALSFHLSGKNDFFNKFIQKIKMQSAS